MSRRSKSRMKKAVMAGAASATALSVCLVPTMANAASSQTYFVGFPDWLSIGDGSTLPSDPVAINNAIVGAKDTNPLIGWGTGGVDLQPVWLRWIDGVPEYTVPVVGQTGSHTETYQGPNPLYQPAYDAAYSAAYNTYCRLSSNRTKCAQDAGNAAVQNIPKLIDFSVEVPDYGVIEDGYWTTTTAGQWITGDDIGDLPTAAQLAYAAYVLENGDLSALAPLLNWTAYFTNVNLIAYGDGSIAAGLAYQAFLDSARGQTHDGYDPYEVGAALTGPRKIVIIDPTGKVTLVSYDETNNPLDLPEIIYPGSGEMPDYESAQDGGVLDLTVLSLVLIRNPGRANGGLYARFAPLYEELTGVNPVSPERQDVLPEGVDPELITNLLSGDTSNLSLDELGNLQAVLESADGKPIVVTLKADVGWQYDLMSDAPVTASPIAWANSVASAIFLTNLLTGVDLDDLGDGGYVGEDGTIYYTIPVDDLPLLAPMRLPAQALGTLMNGDPDSINTPIADALEPALTMLVNTAYTDWVRNEDGTYSRSLDEFGTPTLFGTSTMTREERAVAVGDFISLLGAGVGDEMTDVLLRTKARLSEELGIDLTSEQDAALTRALTAPGTRIRDISHQAGAGVSQTLTRVEAELPQGPGPLTQNQLADIQRSAGATLADVRHDVVEASTTVKAAVDEVRGGLEGGSTTRTTSVSAAKDKASTSSAARKAAVKDSVSKVNSGLKKAGDDAKKAVNKTVDKVKKSLAPKKESSDDD